MDNRLNSHNAFQDKKGARFYYISTLIVCLWGALFFISMNIQYKRGVRLSGYSKEVVALLLALCVLKSARFFAKSRIIKYPVILTMALGWLWSLNDPFYWDGIQTAGRSLILFTDGVNYIERFSLSYVILGILLKYVRNCDWIAHVYIMAVGGLAIYLIGKKQRHPAQFWLAVIMAFITPHLFILSKWVYLDIPVISFIVFSLVAFDQAVRKNSLRWAIFTAILLVVASLMKEIGFIAGIPILILIPFQLRKKRSLKIILPILLGVLASFGILAYLCLFYRRHQPYKSSDVDWLLFNAKKGEHLLSLRWFAWAAQEHLITFLWWGWLIFAMISLIRPKGKRGFAFLLILFTAQIFCLYATRNFQLSLFYPLSDPDANQISLWILFFIFCAFILGRVSGCYRFRRPKRMELISWIMIMGTVFIFSAMGKIYYSHFRKSYWITLDWRYVGPAIPFLVILAAKGVGRSLVRRNPGWLRFAAALTISLCLTHYALRSAMTAAYFSEKARLAGEGYRAVGLRPERVVYTHWPFYWMGRGVLDLGSLKWKSDEKSPRDIGNLKNYLNSKKGVKFKDNAVALQSSEFLYASFRIWNKLPDPFFDKTAQLYYITPFSYKVKKPDIFRVYAAQVQSQDKKEPPVNPEAVDMVRKFEGWALAPKKD